METIITSTLGVRYLRREVTDSWGRTRIVDKRLDDLPKPHAETCSICGTPIEAERSTKQYCSTACRMTAYRRRGTESRRRSRGQPSG